VLLILPWLRKGSTRDHLLVKKCSCRGTKQLQPESGKWEGNKKEGRGGILAHCTAIVVSREEVEVVNGHPDVYHGMNQTIQSKDV